MAKNQKTKDMKKKPNDVELEEINIILRIPKEAVELKVTASLIDDEGQVMKVSTKHPASVIRKMRRAFLDNVMGGDDYDTRYILTEKGLDYLDSLQKGGG